MLSLHHRIVTILRYTGWIISRFTLVRLRFTSVRLVEKILKKTSQRYCLFDQRACPLTVAVTPGTNRVAVTFVSLNSSIKASV